MKKRIHSTSAAFTVLFIAAVASGCSKSVNIDDSASQNGPSNSMIPPVGRNPGPNGTNPENPPAPDGDPISPSCAAEDHLSWRFVQPQPTVNRSVDLLFVIDTSRSLDAERSRIASTLPIFVSQLPPQTDYRIGVMLAHGGSSYYSGRLYSASGTPRVLDSRTQSPASIQSNLTQTLSAPPQDIDSANGEVGMYSLLRSLRTDRLNEMRSQGFYRDGAALSVIFVTDENDVCFRPELNGFTQFPDFVPTLTANTEVTAYTRYCLDSNGTLAVTPERVLNGLRDLKSSQNLALGGIIHKDPASVPRGNGIEDAISHGILELVGSTLNGVTLELANSDYSTGLTELGSVVSSQLRLQNSFGLDGQSPIRPGTIAVHVDDRPVESEFDAVRRETRIRTQDAGAAGSIVEVTACRG